MTEQELMDLSDEEMDKRIDKEEEELNEPWPSQEDVDQ